MSEHESSKSRKATQEERSGLRAYTFQIVIAVIAAGVFLGTHFLLNSWAEASEVNHNMEHIIIFLSGSTLGAALFSMLRSRK